MVITEDKYVEKAKDVMSKTQYVGSQNKERYVVNISTSKLRNLLSMVSDIYNDVVDGMEFTRIKPRLEYLKIRFAYEAGRDPEVMTLYKNAELEKCLDEIDTNNNFILFAHYMEALVAYRKFFGGPGK